MSGSAFLLVFFGLLLVYIVIAGKMDCAATFVHCLAAPRT